MNIVDEAAELNVQYKDIKNKLEAKKDEIKVKGEGKFEGDKYIATVATRVGRRKFNQAKALEVVNRLGAKWLLTQIVDEEKLEDALATGELDAKDFVDCIETSYNTVITFREKKK